MSHLRLCGDSIFDNKAYIETSQPDVINQVRALLPEESKASLFAYDGAVTESLFYQLSSPPEDATRSV